MFVARNAPNPETISRQARAETPVVNVSDPDRWNRLMEAMRGVQTHVIGHAHWQFVCPCCNKGIGLAGQAVDSAGNLQVVASCNHCGADFDDVCNKTPREPLPLNGGGFVAPKAPPPNYGIPVEDQPKRRWTFGRIKR